MAAHDLIAPVVERLLAQAHVNLTSLLATRDRLSNHGLSGEQLPSVPQCRALALLGDWDRHAVLQTHYANGEFAHLSAIGLIRGEIDQCSTPLLRLFAIAAPALVGMRTVIERLQHPEVVTVADPEHFACAETRQGYWGQPARIHWRARGIEFVWIKPDPCFGVAPALLAIGSGETIGHFPISIDDGAILFRALSTDGQIYEHQLMLTTINALAEVSL